MATRPVVTDMQDGFAGGYNGNGATEVVSTNQYASVTNMRVVREREIAKRPGMRSVVASANIDTVTSWLSANNGYQVVTLGSDNHLRYGKFDTTSGIISLSDFGVVTPSVFYGCAHFRDATDERLYVPIQAGHLYKWDGFLNFTALTALVSNIWGVWVYNQRLFGFTGDHTLYWSAINNGDTLGDAANGGGSAIIRTYADSSIVGGLVIGGVNYILHMGGISAFTGRTFDDIQIEAGLSGVLSTVGAYREQSFAAIDGVGYVVTPRGLYLLTENGASPYRQPGLPDPIEDFIRSTAPTTIRVVDNPRANEIWFLCAESSDIRTPDRTTVFIYHKVLQRFTGKAVFTKSGVWANGTPWHGTTLLVDNLGQDLPQMLLMAHGMLVGADFFTSSLEVFQDLGASYTSAVTCRRFFPGSPFSLKQFRRAYVTMGAGSTGSATSGSATGATATLTAADGTTSVDTSALLASETTRLNTGGSGPYADLVITDSGTSSTGWSVARVDVEAFDYGARGR